MIRAVLFVLFFGIGAASLSSAILCEDMAQYYQNKQLLTAAQESLGRLRSLNNEYDVLLEKWQQDPNLVAKRIARATLGPAAVPEPQDPNTAYPRATAQLLAAARKVLSDDNNRSAAERAEPVMPRWLVRCRRRPSRITLFGCGVVVNPTNFVCLRPE